MLPAKDVHRKHHRQRLSAALRMPKDAALTVGNSGFLCRDDCFSDCKILMVSRKDFEDLRSLVREADKVLDNIKQPFFLEHTLKEGVKLCVLCVFIAAVFCFPLHKAVFAGGDCACFRGELVAHYADCIVDKH